ncbi:MerR family DNA-binding transcriptional regulator [Cupriavidus pinatubonensis]|uniref:MerR family DNA-binding transcriptional regulator n=1 Tax=Cupriavidus pinatubonensis TaxID=248026 RepID=UPI0011293BDE|nr:hypothetical protein C2U69_23980 [Cupriavidus pinatubonensis]
MNKPGAQLLSIGEAAAALGVAVAALRRWHRQGRLLPAACSSSIRRPSALCVGDGPNASGAQTPAAGKTLCYPRVSAHDRSAQLPKIFRTSRSLMRLSDLLAHTA